MAWLTGWNYRKSVTVSRASGAVTNFQLSAGIGESAGAAGEAVDCGGKCKTDFSDLRFTTSDGTTLLDYWIESTSGTTPNQLANTWVEFDSIGTGDTTFYMYYGNAAATSTSDITGTMYIGDKFNDSSYTPYWQTYETLGATGTRVEDSSKLLLTQTGSGTAAWAVWGVIKGGAAATQLSGFYVKTRFYATLAGNTGNKAAICNIYNTDYTQWYQIGNGKDTSNNADYRIAAVTDGLLYQSTTYTSGTYSIWEVVKTDNNLTIYINGVSRYTTANSRQGTFRPVILGVLSNQPTTDYPAQGIDYFYVTRRESTQPAWGSWGAEEIPPAQPTGNYLYNVGTINNINKLTF